MILAIMNKQMRYLLAALLFTLVIGKYSYGSHAMGLDLTYECLGNNEYEFTLNFYQDCAGLVDLTDPSLTISSTSCNQILNLDLTEDLTISGQEVSQICDDENSTCTGGTIQGVEQYIWTGTITLPEECDDWIISFSECCRNDAITNLEDADLYDLYVEALLVNTDGLCNNSPTFTSLPVPYLCINQQNFYNHGVFDVDGNTLQFTLINPMDQGAVDIPYNPGFTPDMPITTDPGDFNFDASSGQMIFTPTMEEVDVITVLVEEFDEYGNLIGSIIRDIQIILVDCDNEQSTLAGGITGLDQTQATLIDSTTVEVCPGATLDFEIVGVDPDSMDTLFLNTNLASAIPDAVFTTSGINPITGSFTWTPTQDDIGLNSFSVVLQDNSCPIPSSQIFGFNIFVIEGANAGPDQVYCNAGGPVTIVAAGGSVFTWTTDQADDGIVSQSANGDTLVVAPDQTTTYFLESNLNSFNCQLFDTVVVSIAPDFPYTVTPNLDVCRFEDIQLSLDADPAFGPYTYLWDPPEGLSDFEIANPTLVADQSVSYTVTATSAEGCEIVETVNINVTGVAPIVNLAEEIETQICIGEETQLDVLTCCPECEISELQTGFNESPYDGFWEDGRIQLLFTAQELIDIGLTGCAINSIAFNVLEKNSTQPYSGFTIRMENTNLTNLPATFEPLTNIVYGPLAYDTFLGWNTHTFDTPFNWDGASNVIVEVCFDNLDWTSEDPVSFHSTPFTSVGKAETDGQMGCTLALETNSTERPDVIFTTDGTSSLTTATISWDPPTGLNDPSIVDPIASPTQTTLYTINVTDNGCTGTDTITIFVTDQSNYVAGPDTFVCNEQDVQLALDGPLNPGFSYSWDPPTGLSDPNIANPIAQNVSADAQYIVTVTNTGGCDIVDTVDITFGQAIDYFVPENDSICFGNSLPISISGGDTYLWEPATGLSCSDCPNPIISADTTTTYTVQISDSFNVGEGCPVEEEYTIVVNPNPLIDAGEDITFFKGDDVFITVDGQFTDFSFNTGLGLSDSTSTNPQYLLLEDFTYVLTAENEFGCIDIDSINIRYLGCRGIVVPTAFSPNLDGQNDEIKVVDLGIDEFLDFTIYNRWGTQVFTSSDITEGWDGIYNNTKQPLGAYVYYARVRCDNEIIEKSGNITLIR